MYQALPMENKKHIKPQKELPPSKQNAAKESFWKNQKNKNHTIQAETPNAKFLYGNTFSEL